ncbi:conserved hypothetical protein [Paraburkholderia piptadeniae]|uniref:Uncharacterized protein n=1 Tax=Paraburkholderia piptadeniae TaxID=1701573 RepID=A0A1N7SUC6_9BURK|nr:ureidoglycolate hydrolase [Paraburkholderia piptadeniae]SIT50942.1 conserved hypothetical protein [Paraburkholderia piptadeniae]
MTVPLLTIERLTSDAFLPYGWVLGEPPGEQSDVPYFESSALKRWHAHLFETGTPNEVEILWTRIGDDNPFVRTLETRLLTQEVVVPLTAPLIQIVAAPLTSRLPDMRSLRAYEIPVGLGTCIRPGCWQATRVLAGRTTALMLSRRSTTFDRVVHLHTGAPTAESSEMPIWPHKIATRSPAAEAEDDRAAASVYALMSAW